GHVGYLGFALLPYALNSFHHALDGDRRHLVYGALVLAWIIGHFGVYPFPYACLALGVYGALVGWRTGRRRSALWVIARLIALALGVFLMFQIGNVPLFPWWLVKHLPIFHNLRVPSRFTIVAGLFACVCAGAAVDEALRRARDGGWRRWLAPAAALLAIAFFL